MTTRLRVMVEIPYTLDKPLQVAIDLDDDFMQMEVLSPIKLSDGPFALFDTPQAVVRRVRYTREHFIKRITPDLVKALADLFSAKDTFNGYTKQEREQFAAQP